MKQEKKNRRLLILLFFLTTSVVFLFRFMESGPPAIDKTIFRIDDQVKIDRVETESITDGKLVLKFEQGKWKVNDSLEADRQTIKVFFATLLQAIPKRKFPGTLPDSVMREAVKVKLFEGNELVKEFTVGGNPTKGETYFVNSEGAAYVMSIPGYRVYIASVFSLGANDWRDKRLFNFNWQNFKKLVATIPPQPDQSFTITFIGNFFGIEGMTKMDTTKVNDFLDAVSLAQAERYLAPGEAAAYLELIKKVPDFQIDVQDIAKRNYQLQVFISAADQKIVGKINERDLIYLNPRAFLNLQRKKDYFVKR